MTAFIWNPSTPSASSVWNPGESINVNADTTLKSETFNATAGQTVFTLTSFTYTPNTGSLFVMVNGVCQVSGLDYTETSSTVITLAAGVNAGDRVQIIGFVGVTANLTVPVVTADAFWGGTAAGTATDLTLVISGYTAYTDQDVIRFKTSLDTTGATTLNVNGIGARNLKTQDGAALGAKILIAGGIYTAVYDGTDFILSSASDVISRYVVSIGKTPDAWSTSYRVLELTGYTAVYGQTTVGRTFIAQNLRYDPTTGLVYRNSTTASLVDISATGFYFYKFPAGVAGAAASITDKAVAFISAVTSDTTFNLRASAAGNNAYIQLGTAPDLSTSYANIGYVSSELVIRSTYFSSSSDLLPIKVKMYNTDMMVFATTGKAIGAFATPKTGWYASSYALEFPSLAIFDRAGSYKVFADNIYTTGAATYAYKNTSGVPAAFFGLISGDFHFRTAASGAADAAVTFEEQFRIIRTASAVNYLEVTGAATGNSPLISAKGSDTNIDLRITAKGTGTVKVGSALQVTSGRIGLVVNPDTYGWGGSYSFIEWDPTVAIASDGALTLFATNIYHDNIDYRYKLASFGMSLTQDMATKSFAFDTFASGAAGAVATRETQFYVLRTASAVNYLQAAGAATGNSPTLSAVGSDTNIHITLAAKGTGGLITPQHVGVGAAPAAWSTWNTIDLNSGAIGGSSSEAFWQNNIYYNSGFKYKANGYGHHVELNASGNFVIYTAPNNVSGAGAAATITERLTLDVSGNLVIDGKYTSSDSISGFVTGVTEYLENDTGAVSTNFDYATNIGTSFESVGPTGSGATNIWTALNSIPTGAKWVEIRGYMSIANSGADDTQGYLYARKTGSASVASLYQTVVAVGHYETVDTNAGGGDAWGSKRVPLDSSMRFDLTAQRLTGTSWSGNIYVVGFAV